MKYQNTKVWTKHRKTATKKEFAKLGTIKIENNIEQTVWFTARGHAFVNEKLNHIKAVFQKQNSWNKNGPWIQTQWIHPNLHGDWLKVPKVNTMDTFQPMKGPI